MTTHPSILTVAAAQPTGTNLIEGFLIAGGIGIITFVMLRSLLKRRKRDRKEYETPSEKIDRITSQGMPRDRIETLMVEAQELTRVCAAQIESKAAVLENLIAMADERIARLQELGANPADLMEAAHRRAEPEPRRAAPISPPPDPLTRKVYELADTGSESIDIARQLDEQVGKVDLILALRAH